MANAEEIRRVVKVIQENPGSWQQSLWVACDHHDEHLPTEILQHRPTYKRYDCNTRACVAGHTVMMAGLNVDHTEGVWDADGAFLGSVPIVAQRILGLTDAQAKAIFDPDTGYVGNDEYEVAVLKEVITFETGVTFDE